jgi:hypothetical protein
LREAPGKQGPDGLKTPPETKWGSDPNSFRTAPRFAFGYLKDIAMDVVDLPLGQVIPYARNPRRNEKAVAAVAASIKEFG